jgi:hypothetical protein
VSLARAQPKPDAPEAPETPEMRVSPSSLSGGNETPVLRGKQKRPLVYATKTAREQAARLLPGQVLEQAVAREILAGHVIGPVKASLVFAGDGSWETRRTPGRLRPRPRPWLVLTVRGGKQWPM